jgi:hypothetical protein
MCFSASMSFAASTVLIPVGLYCLQVARPHPAYLPLASVPLLFGLQQGVEGIVWSGIQAHNAIAIQAGALAFLWFSHWVWLVWPPYIALRLEPDPSLQRVCQGCLLAGALAGALLYLPLVMHPDWLSVAVRQGSLEYQARFIGEAIPNVLTRLVYALIILIPLLISSHVDLKIWGLLIAGSALLSVLIFNYAFVSVWCFFAALLSLYILRVLLKINRVSSEQALS